MYDSAGGYTGDFDRLFTDNKEEKVIVITFRHILNGRQMLLEQPDYKNREKNRIHSEEGKDDEQTD